MRNKHNNKGFGLIEVLITAVLLIIITSSVIGLSRTIVRNSVISTQRTQAFNLMRQEVESIIAKRNINWDDGKDWLTDIDPVNNQLLSELEGISYYYTINTDEVKNNFADTIDNDYKVSFLDNAKMITVTIDWMDGGKDFSIVESFILTNWKPQL